MSPDGHNSTVAPGSGVPCSLDASSSEHEAAPSESPKTVQRSGSVPWSSIQT